MNVSISRLVVAGLSGDSGKTIVCLSFISALRDKGFSVSTFKKGPDYIDAAWLTYASGGDCRNLDTYMIEPEVARDLFVRRACQSDFAIIEGNRGIFDGKDAEGSHSSAGLAKLLQAPIVLVVNCAKVTRTVAALINGCVAFEPGVRIAGAVINNYAGERHKKTIIESIEKYGRIPVVGAIPKLEAETPLIPGRHLGLMPPTEFAAKTELAENLRAMAEKYLDIESLIAIAKEAPPINRPADPTRLKSAKSVKIGYFSDSVFTFYYPENLEALIDEGAELIKISSLDDRSLPEIDALYIGGGFPETFAERIAANRSMLASVKMAAEEGMPIYAECGGLIYLARSLTYKDNKYQMAGVFPIDLKIYSKPRGHGYTLAEVDYPNPFFPVGESVKGHEFHYSGPIGPIPPEIKSCMQMKTGIGLENRRDGLVYKCAMAGYTHIHACGAAEWAAAMVRNAANFNKYRARKYQSGGDTKSENDRIFFDRETNKNLFSCGELAIDSGSRLSAG
jgi:cobyrinic acid a,c-diamide synthase